ncbi:MAG TPA: hypothetical protein VI750_03225 [Pyrinomonadaceae bacterium]|nr:hypothetical protein [Pyrinomonadaceae bacterium]HLE62121.1 hypothetical protein [Pyrinomonadaceae bacterium]
MYTLRPGNWYVRYVCQGCKTKQILFPDLSNGTARIKADYVVTCQDCGHQASYDSEVIERYYHPVDGDGHEGDGKR